MQLLDITCGYAGGGFFGTHTFDAAPLARLPRLHTLILRGFEEPCLWGGLPRTLRVLRCFGGQHNNATHDPVRYPRHHWALPAYCRPVRGRGGAQGVRHAGWYATAVVHWLLLLFSRCSIALP